MGWLRKGNLPALPDVGLPRLDGPLQGRGLLDRLIGPNDAAYPDPTFASNADRGFGQNELVYACIMEKATSLPDAPFRVYGPDGKGEPREQHPLRQLLANPNPCTTEFELLEMTSIYMDLAGIAFWEVVTDRAGMPVELWPLRPDMVRIFPKQDGRHEYGYALGNGRIVPLGRNVLAFKYPNPADPLLGQAPMRAANRAVALDNEATDFVKALLQNRAVPGTVIETEQRIDDALVDRLTAKWIERFGKGNRGLPAFMQKGMKIHTLGLNLGELEFPDLRTISESRICMSFGVPPILVGAKVGLDRSTFANYQEARRSLWEETLMPLQRRIAGVIVQRLLPMVEGPRPRRVVCQFDNSEVLALKESEANRWEKGTQALRAGGLLLNDFRRYVGLPAVEGGDVFLIPAGVVPVANPSKMPTPAPTAPPAADEPPAEVDTPAEGDEAPDGPQKALTRMALKARTPLALAIAEVAAEQRDEVTARVDRAKALITIAPDRFTGEVWERGKWNRRLAAAMEPHVKALVHAAARQVAPEVPVEDMDGYVAVATTRVASRWNDETRDHVAGAVALGGPDVSGHLSDVFSLTESWRADHLARSFANEMSGFAKVDAARRAGLAAKAWVARCDAHLGMDGETVAVDQPFSTGHGWPMGCGCDVSLDGRRPAGGDPAPKGQPPERPWRPGA